MKVAPFFFKGKVLMTPIIGRRNLAGFVKNQQTIYGVVETV